MLNLGTIVSEFMQIDVAALTRELTGVINANQITMLI